MPLRASTHSPESSAIAGRPVWRPTARALIRALVANVAPVSATSGSVGNASDPTSSMSESGGVEDAVQLGDLARRCGSRAPRAGSRSAPDERCRRRGRRSGRPAARPLHRREPRAAAAARSSSASSIGPVERRALGRALDLHEAARAGHHHVHVGIGPHVVVVVEVQAGLAVDDPHAHRRDRVRQRLLPAATSPRPCAQATASARATYAPVIAAVRVPPSAWRTSQSSTIVFSPSAADVDRRAQRATDQPRDLVRPATDPARGRTRGPSGVLVDARQHRVLGGDPPGARPLPPARHARR